MNSERDAEWRALSSMMRMIHTPVEIKAELEREPIITCPQCGSNQIRVDGSSNSAEMIRVTRCEHCGSILRRTERKFHRS